MSISSTAIKTLRMERTSDPASSRKVSGPSGGGKPALSEISESAALHGKELLQQGFTVEDVVHDYGDLCQSITALAFEQDAFIHTDEFRTLNRCLDNAIANAVTEFGHQHDFVVAGLQAERSGAASAERSYMRVQSIPRNRGRPRPQGGRGRHGVSGAGTPADWSCRTTAGCRR